MTATTQHTPGPLSFKEDGEANVYAIFDDRGDWLAIVKHNGRQWQREQVANLNIWTAAPDLLRAAIEVWPSNLGRIPDDMPDDAVLPVDITAGELRQLALAIAKAEGRS